MQAMRCSDAFEVRDGYASLRHARACRGHPRLSFEVKTWMAGTSPAMTKESPRAPLRRRELHQLDRIEVLHAAADALGRVEQHVRLGGERVAQHVHALAV